MDSNFPVQANYSFWLSVGNEKMTITYYRIPFRRFCHPTRPITESINCEVVKIEFRGRAAGPKLYYNHFAELEDVENANHSPYLLAETLAKGLYETMRTKHPEFFCNQLNLF